MKAVTLKLSLSVVFYCTLAWSVEVYSDDRKIVEPEVYGSLATLLDAR